MKEEGKQVCQSHPPCPDSEDFRQIRATIFPFSSLVRIMTDTYVRLILSNWRHHS
jgi:hypothetical protein